MNFELNKEERDAVVGAIRLRLKTLSNYLSLITKQK